VLNLFNLVFKRVIQEINQNDKDYGEMEVRGQQFSEKVRARMAEKEIEFAKRKERHNKMFSYLRKDAE
jgi:hypothetical protein